MSAANFSTKHTSLKDLIKYAYNIKSDDQLAGGRGWMGTEFFEVEVKAADSEIEGRRSARPEIGTAEGPGGGAYRPICREAFAKLR
jgi:uncharacterized protein (TIGR03435 family)